ncbi:hypothetical protein GGR28_000798 [Lewinella aquimaris]|uniref:DUF2383 domain-containing protein n=1 Tax=Neolewinella aquimaris TaxID=1835722 RepID=A0A840E4Y8_9BACT|nr:hypothetical protein [Neolewinella aquimaris]MBB4078197.1 hypothetical protein [Neolewinella aquimaris]
MKTPYEIRPEGTDTTLSQIAMEHQQSAGYYRDISSAIRSADDTAANFFDSLAAYHEEMLQKINGILEDISGGVHTPSRSSETELKRQEAQLNRALQAKNVVELASLAHQNEEGISNSYEHALANTNLLDFAEEILHAQHQEILVWVNRADRYKTVPQDRNEHYD